MQRRSQSKSIQVAQRRVLARVVSTPDDLKLVRGGSLTPPLDAIVTAPPPGRDYSSPSSEGEPIF